MTNLSGRIRADDPSSLQLIEPFLRVLRQPVIAVGNFTHHSLGFGVVLFVPQSCALLRRDAANAPDCRSRLSFGSVARTSRACKGSGAASAPAGAPRRGAFVRVHQTLRVALQGLRAKPQFGP